MFDSFWCIKEQICFPNPLDTFKIYLGSSNNIVSRNTICRWFIRRHFEPETCVGFPPREVHGKTIPEIAVPSGSIVVVTVMFSFDPSTKDEVPFRHSPRTSHREYFVQGRRIGTRSSYPFHPSSRPTLLFSCSNFVICFRGCLKIVFTLLYALRLSSPTYLPSLNDFRRFVWRLTGEEEEIRVANLSKRFGFDFNLQNVV